MNTWFLGPAVATVLTVYGIETICSNHRLRVNFSLLQQCLPFTVLKPKQYLDMLDGTVLGRCNSAYRLRY